jgi:hypothetical protein
MNFGNEGAQGRWCRGPVRRFLLATFSYTLFDLDAAFFYRAKVLLKLKEFRAKVGA